MKAGIKKGLDFIVEELANVEEEIRTLNARRRNLINLQATLAKVKREKKEDRKETVPTNRANDYRPMTAAALALSDESRGRRLMILTYLESTGKATIGAIGRAVGLDIPQVQNLLNQMIEGRHIKGLNNGTYSHPNYKQKQTVKS